MVIMWRNWFEGGDGWTYGARRVEIKDTCPICGGKRGTPYNYAFCEDGEWFNVDRWENPCGHIDSYALCWQEHKELQEQKNETQQ